MATNSQVQTVVPGSEKVKLILAVVLAIAAFVVYFLLDGNPSISGWMRWLSLLGLLVCAGAVFLLSMWGKRLIAYFGDSIKEVKKVVWPTRQEAGQMTLYVFIFVTIMALFLWLIDMLLQWGIFSLLLGWSQ